MTFLEVRLLHMMTQQQLAKKLNTVHSTITHWESGRRQPSMRYRKKIARLFDLSPEEILQIFPPRPRRPRDAA